MLKRLATLIMRNNPREDPPVPPDSPERDPDWCHAHKKKC